MDDKIDKRIIDYIAKKRPEPFAAFADADLISLSFPAVCGEGETRSRIVIWYSREDLFVFYEENAVLNRLKSIIEEGLPPETALYSIFVSLMDHDMNDLNLLEEEITREEDEALRSPNRDYLRRIVSFRKQLFRLKRYYSEMTVVMENICADVNDLLTPEGERHFNILLMRAERLNDSVLHLRDYVTQMREAYQSQIDIEQNALMKIFTIITAIFLPLTLLVGWYGMNFKYMPELEWQYGYPVFIITSIVVILLLYQYFKKRGWF